MKVKVIYTIETEYNFNDEYVKSSIDEEDIDNNSAEKWATNWIKEDFYKVENRADNVLPVYSSNLDITIEEEENEET